MTTELATKKCEPCQGGQEPLKGDALRQYEAEIDNAWQVVDEHHLERTFDFDNYDQSVEFANKVADIAKAEDHHPDILLTYDQVKVTVWTHKIGGLSENDFIFAAKVDAAAS
jgi:4a-hydroxytetrahydrobiopterin dehydratase